MSSGPNHDGVKVDSMPTTGHSDKDTGDAIHHTTYGDSWGHVSWDEDKSTGAVSGVHTTTRSDNPTRYDNLNADPDTINRTQEQ